MPTSRSRVEQVHVSTSRLVRVAWLLSALALVGGTVSGVLAYRAARDAALETLTTQARHAARVMSEQAAEAGRPAPEVLGPLWSGLGAEPGQFSCFIGPDARVRFHSLDPGRLGVDADLIVSSTPQGAGPRVSELVRRDGPWEGWIRWPSGEQQWLAGHTRTALGGAVVVHAPLEQVEGYVRRRAVPWVLGLSLPWLAVPASLGLLALALRRFERVARREADARDTQEQHLTLLARHLRAVLWINTPGHAGPRYVSPAYEEYFGSPPEAFARDAEAFFSAVVPEDRERLREFSRQVRTGPASLVYQVRDARGQLRWLETRGGPAPAAPGEPVTVLGVTEDVTERRRLQGQLEAQERLAALGTLSAGLAHELNNPLSFLLANLGYVTSVLGDRGAPQVLEGAALAELRDATREAQDAAERLATLAADMRTFSRTDAGVVQPLDVHAVVRKALRLVGPQLKHRARVVVELAPVPSPEANESRLVQVLLNLLVNAAHALGDEATPDTATVTVRAWDEPDTGGARWVRVQVRDSGPGLTPDVQARLFEPYQTTKAPGAGTGLGLFLCRQLLESQGGTIAGENAPGGGAVFTVSLPLTAARDAAAAARA